MSLRGERIAQAYLDACLTELRSLKPGNVHALAAGHRMTVAQFETSARVTAPVMAQRDLAVGHRIREAVRRTREAVGCNTNLGILLLCAPLAAAAHAAGGGDLRSEVPCVLAGLDVADAENAFAAIRLAGPAGLGEAPQHDVRRRATVGLRAAMAAAQDRDLIARQYASDFADVFDLGVARLAAGIGRWSDLHWATTSAYLGFLAAFPDSHVARKHGPERAAAVQRAADVLDRELLSCASPREMTPALLAFDDELKRADVNPGTSADLTVASLFAFGLGAAAAINSHNPVRAQ